ncbi:hypothetical protein [Frankia sp. AiPa1]|uniref:hypothetical protein n=1 Tax=Frankia sp. AiPa1 TaxID=573492 RepID=UPI00202ADE0E|nr:hypothetical protein [Frankia sp. AiPa1]MCL9761901.1 hypothetical protein [Frankia sp. AiPa1]
MGEAAPEFTPYVDLDQATSATGSTPAGSTATGTPPASCPVGAEGLAQSAASPRLGGLDGPINLGDPDDPVWGDDGRGAGDDHAGNASPAGRQAGDSSVAPLGPADSLPLPAAASPRPRRTSDHGGRRRPPARPGPRRPGSRRGRVLVGAAVVGVSAVMAVLLALVIGVPGSESPNPPVTTVSSSPHPIGTPWVTTASPTSVPGQSPSALRPSGAPPPPAGAAPRDGTGDPAQYGASGRPGPTEAVAAPVTRGRYTSQTAPFPAGSQVQLPIDAADWVLFGDGLNGVRTRAALPVPRIIAFASGDATMASSSGFNWFGGFPNLFGSKDNQRLSVRGTAILSTLVVLPRKLQIYLGASTGTVRISISSLADTRTFTVDLPSRQVDGSSDAMITLTLPGAIGSTVVTVSSVDGQPWTLAAAVLR